MKLQFQTNISLIFHFKQDQISSKSQILKKFSFLFKLQPEELWRHFQMAASLEIYSKFTLTDSQNYFAKPMLLALLEPVCINTSKQYL